MAGVARSRTAASWQRNSQKIPLLSGGFGEVRMPGLGRVETAAVGLPRSRAGVNWKSQSGHHQPFVPSRRPLFERLL